MFLPSVAVCLAQAINISGVVKNNEGSGIKGAMVRLGKADIVTTTDFSGNFTLTGTVSGVQDLADDTAHYGDHPFILKDNKVFFTVVNQVEVKVMVYDCNGRLLVSRVQNVSPKGCPISLPRLARGIYIYRVSMNKNAYTFKGTPGISLHRDPVSSGRTISLQRKSKTAAQIDDALLFTKEGFQLFRLAVTNPDTSNVEITMIPLVTGTVTDTDGNVYQTVQYGNQVWTVENLRTTRYNDGTSVPLVSDSVTWSQLETPAYCFYDYTTDTAEQRKWGAFYNGYTVNTGKLAPTGWHVSTNEDWDTLQNYLIASGYNFDGTTTENKIAKSMAVKMDWLASTDSGAIGNDSSKNNASGFSGLPNGYCDYAGETYYRSWYAFWWTATEQDSTFVKIRGISYHTSDLKSSAFTKIYGLSVRLVRD